MSFLKESMKEFDHVVWPTPAETKKYFSIVVSMIIILTLFLFIVGTAFSVGIFSLKKQVSPLSEPVSTSATTLPSQDLKLDNVNVNTVPVTPTTTTPAAPTK